MTQPGAQGHAELDIRNDPVLRWLRAGVIGRDATLMTALGVRRKRYFDQTASGLPFAPIEQLLRDRVLPMMTNTHTEANTCSRAMTTWYQEAHEKARRALNAQDDDVVIFTGSGATGAINKLIGLLGISIPDNFAMRQGCKEHLARSERPVVIRSRMEHHSNDITWRETISDTEHVGYDNLGRPDWRDLDRILSSPRYRDRKLKIGTFSAASNVTGIVSDVDNLARVMHEHGGYAFFDYAAAAPYVPVDLHPEGDPATRKDAVFISMHKFVGGPQTPGLLAVNRALFKRSSPVEPGGGTVLYTSPWEYRYLDDLQHREEGGTPPIVQVIRAGLVLELKDLVGVERIHAVEQHYLQRAIREWRKVPEIRILGDLNAPRIGVLSLILDNGALHHNLAVRLLNDLYGIQTRGGCMCAGTYGHDLLGIDQSTSKQIRDRLDEGDLASKPGWIRVGFNPATSEGEFRVLLEAVPHVARHWRRYADAYEMDLESATWYHKDGEPDLPRLTLEPSFDG
jgi:selenocysteine lyase/cysteine desulfurase